MSRSVLETFEMQDKELQKRSYPYLDRHFNHESFELVRLAANDQEATGTVKVIDPCCSIVDGMFLLKGPMALSIAGQAGICWLKKRYGVDDRNAPVWLRRFTVECHKRIKKTENVQILLHMSEEIIRDGKVSAILKFDIESHSFDGEIKLVMPLPAHLDSA